MYRGFGMKNVRWGSFADVLFLLFVAGSIIGCVTANLLSGELLMQIGYFDSIYQWKASFGPEEKGDFWRYVMRRRFLEFGTGALVGMTPLAKWAFGGIAAIFGFNCGLAISVFTLESGWMGLLLFLRTTLPQWIFYGLAWVILAVGCENGLEKMKIRVWFFLALLILVGSLLEAFLR